MEKIKKSVVMEEENSKIKQLPSFPSNYVTLVQLQERWLKEKQQKEQEKAAAQKIEFGSGSHNGEKKREVPVSEMGTGDVGGDGADHVGEGGEEKKKKKKNNKKKNKKKLKEKKLELKEEEAPLENSEKEEKTRGARGKSRASFVNDEKKVVVNALLVNGEKEGNDISEGRNQGSRRRIKGENRARAFSVNGEKVEKEAVVETPLANGEKEQVSEKRRTHKRRGNRGEARVESNGLDQSRASSVNDKKIYVIPRKEALLKAPLNLKDVRKTMGGSRKESNVLDQTTDVEPKFRGLSVNDGNGDDSDEGLRRTSAYHDRGYKESRSHGSRRFGHRGLRNGKDARMVWVKKEEVFDGNGCGAQKPGTSRAVSGFGQSTKRKTLGSARHRNNETLY